MIRFAGVGLSVTAVSSFTHLLHVTWPYLPRSNFLLKLLQLVLCPAVSMADGYAGVAADRADPRQDLQWEIHEHGAELQVHGIQVPIPSFLPGMPANTPLTDLNVTVCLRLQVADLCVHIAKKRAVGEATNKCAHLTAVHTDAPLPMAPMAAKQAESMTGDVSAGPSPEIPSVPVGDTQIEVGDAGFQIEIGETHTPADDTQADDTQAESQQG